MGTILVTLTIVMLLSCGHTSVVESSFKSPEPAIVPSATQRTLLAAVDMASAVLAVPPRMYRFIVALLRLGVTAVFNPVVIVGIFVLLCTLATRLHSAVRGTSCTSLVRENSRRYGSLPIGLDSRRRDEDCCDESDLKSVQNWNEQNFDSGSIDENMLVKIACTTAQQFPVSGPLKSNFAARKPNMSLSETQQCESGVTHKHKLGVSTVLQHELPKSLVRKLLRDETLPPRFPPRCVRAEPLKISLARIVMTPKHRGACALCLDLISPGKRAVVLLCRHVYHRTCFRAYLPHFHSCPACVYTDYESQL